MRETIRVELSSVARCSSCGEERFRICKILIIEYYLLCTVLVASSLLLASFIVEAK